MIGIFSVIEKRFLDYISSISFTKEQDNILNILKLEHTNRVVNLSEILAESVFNTQEDYIILSKIIAVLHDIARWDQMKTYGGFTDIQGDHGETGAAIISRNDMLNGIETKYKQIVLTAIREHNKKYSGKYDKFTQMFVDIIRDADKIDNLYIEVENYNNSDKSLKNILPFSGEHRLSQKIYDNIMSESVSDSKDRETIIDFKFFKMSWCYEIKIPKSIEIIRESKYIGDIYSDISNPDDMMIKAYEKICEYLENRIT
ncbi:MAG: HD domain-containing protein [Oscillospiraceae bacterium]|nr:HD domain-containing protein [Oscillospiraceae bacterium]